MISTMIEEIIKIFNWHVVTRMYGSSHSSNIGFLSSDWLRNSKEHSILDGAPSPLIGKGRTGQKNSDILLCKGDKPYVVVEVETTVAKYIDKIDSIAAYIKNKEAYDGIQFGLMVMLNYTNGVDKYKHNWDATKEYVLAKDIPIAFVSIEKEKADLGNTVLDKLKRRNEYYPWEVSSIDYWVYGSDKSIQEGNLFTRDGKTVQNEGSNNKENKVVISNLELDDIILSMGLREFTVLDVYDYIKENDKSLWESLNRAYINSESINTYSHFNYLSNKLISYSKQKESLLQPHVPYDRDRSQCFRKVSDIERKRFRSENIAVFRCKSQ